MASTANKKIPASILDMTANDLVNALVEAGISYRTIEQETGLERSDISRWRNGLRQASESKWRVLAKYALDKIKTL